MCFLTGIMQFITQLKRQECQVVREYELYYVILVVVVGQHANEHDPLHPVRPPNFRIYDSFLKHWKKTGNKKPLSVQQPRDPGHVVLPDRVQTAGLC